MGAIAYREAPDTMETMVRDADALMYLAKAAGKNCLHLRVAESTEK
jgi:PleD family two-component response regulator